MKIIEHPNIINLIEVIDDPESDNLYMGNQLIFDILSFLVFCLYIGFIWMIHNCDIII